MTEEITIIVKRSQKTKRIRIKIDDALNVVLTAPKYTSKESCEKVVRQHHEWILKQITEKRISQKESLEILNKHKDAILLFGEWIDKPKGKLKNFLKKELEGYIKQKTAEIAKSNGLDFTNITIRMAKSRWGSCSSKKSLNFSLLLAFAHKWVIDYVIAHELAHLAHHNHSKEYWNFLVSIDKNHKEATRYLTQKREFFLNILKIHNIV